VVAAVAVPAAVGLVRRVPRMIMTRARRPAVAAAAVVVVVTRAANSTTTFLFDA
jgi:hypothetical protein